MDHPGFWAPAGPFSLSEVAAHTGSRIAEAFLARADQPVTTVKALDDAGNQDASFFDNRKYLAALQRTEAAAVFISPEFVNRAPAHTVPLLSPDPYRSFAKSLELFFPDAHYTKVGSAPERGAGLIDASARIEEGAIVESGAIIGPEAQIGRGTRIAAGAAVGYRVAIGRDCFVGPGASVTHA
ncbi:MAG: UDP-3-O-(3-hydroxymyristoyl)glucosamine N-acyltransferase, partial [Rhodomicrobium sp.]|nr:UDP-3-O-(3-hydroxymyristoyl)glucosamine N-acyltransferase [Rhodomicrobium sp.]